MNDRIGPVNSASVLACLPWQQDTLATMLEQRQQDRLGHAYLVSGIEGTGVEQYALALASTILCEQTATVACGRCPSCRLMAGGAHPDFNYVGLENASVLKIDQIRQLIHFASATAARSGYRCIVISPAEALNSNAANALLKLLEEPGERTLLLLVTYSSQGLLPTIASRCQRLNLAAPNTEQSQQWLQTQDIHEEFMVPHYFAKPLHAVYEQEQYGLAVMGKIQRAFTACMQQSISIAQFVSETEAVPALQLVDNVYSLALQYINQSQDLYQTPTVYQSLDQLLRFKRALKKGSTENQGVFYQTWWQQWLRQIR